MAMRVVELAGVSKRYRVHYEQSALVTLLGARLTGRKNWEDVWALRDINLVVEQGEVLGIVGVNGSGKTTLLRAIAGVTRVEKGAVQVQGKVATLLDIGAGLQGELTGRENVHLNGLLMGLRGAQVAERMESIMEFAGLERFIDADTRTYSAGMRMRLGFAVAVNTDSDILVVDEVLAVGDSAFQRKCWHAMGEFNSRGKTIIFVSHDLGTISNFATRAVWLEEGRVVLDDGPQEVVEAYQGGRGPRQPVAQSPVAGSSRVEPYGGHGLLGTGDSGATDDGTSRSASGGKAIVDGFKTIDSSGSAIGRPVRAGDDVTIQFHCWARQPVSVGEIRLRIDRSDGLHVCTLESGRGFSMNETAVFGWSLPELPLVDGAYVLSLAGGELLVDEACKDVRAGLRVVVQGLRPEARYGVMTLKGTWTHGKGGDAGRETTRRECVVGSRWGTGEVSIAGVRWPNTDSFGKAAFRHGSAFTVRICYAAQKSVEGAVIGIGIHRKDGLQIAGPNTKADGVRLPALSGSGWVEYSLDQLSLAPGEYLLSVEAADAELTLAYDHHHVSYGFTVGGPAVPGVAVLRSRWHVERVTGGADSRG